MTYSYNSDDSSGLDIDTGLNVGSCDLGLDADSWLCFPDYCFKPK